ncbi:MAG: TraB/GumN family protein [Cellvibrionaceae bacterium]
MNKFRNVASRRAKSTFATTLLAILFTFSAQVFSQPSLWQVKDPQSHAKLYLFGSIHFGVESLYPLPEHVINAYSESDALAVELDLSSISAPEAARVLKSVGRLPDQQTIRERLDDNTWQSLNRVCRALELPIESMERFRPWLVAVQLTATQIRRNGYSEGYGVDRHFLTLAKHPLAPKRVIQLETFEQQMSLFGDLNAEQQSLFLEQTLDELEFAPDMLGSVIDAWADGNEIELETLVIDAFQAEDAQPLYQRIFVERNENMQRQLNQSLKKGETLFVVVGAGHVIGPDGLKQRFVDQGFVVELVEPDGLIFDQKTED